MKVGRPEQLCVANECWEIDPRDDLVPSDGKTPTRVFGERKSGPEDNILWFSRLKTRERLC